MEVLIGMVLLFLAVVIYFLPSFIAANSSKRNTTAIFILNLFLGWTGIGWVIALIWAVMHEERR